MGVLLVVYFVDLFFHHKWLKRDAVKDVYAYLVQWFPIFLDVFQMGLQSQYFKVSKSMTRENSEVMIMPHGYDHALPEQPEHAVFGLSCVFVAFFLFIGFNFMNFEIKKTKACSMYGCKEETLQILHANSNLSSPKDLGTNASWYMLHYSLIPSAAVTAFLFL